jgi:hypothetical protein
VGKQNQRFSDLDGVLFDKIRNRILHYPAGNPNTCYTIPDGITAIESSAFSGCKYLKMVYLSRKTSIANYAFAETSVKFFYKD